MPSRTMHDSPPLNLSKNFSDAKPGTLFVLQTPLEKSLAANVGVIKVLNNLGYKGVYVTLAKDFGELAKLITAQEVSLESLTFIDGISQLYGIGEKGDGHVAYVPGPLSLEQITEHVEKDLLAISGTKRYVFLDSLTIILLYNALPRTKEFGKTLHDLLGKYHALGIFVSVSESSANKELLEELQKLGGEIILT